MKRITSEAVQLDADVCNALETPARGCHAGKGVHVEIPSDWATRIALGQYVPGCTYHALNGADALSVSATVVSRLDVVAIVNTLPVPLKAQAALLKVKLLTATLAVGGR